MVIEVLDRVAGSLLPEQEYVALCQDRVNQLRFKGWTIQVHAGIEAVDEERTITEAHEQISI